MRRTTDAASQVLGPKRLQVHAGMQPCQSIPQAQRGTDACAWGQQWGAFRGHEQGSAAGGAVVHVGAEVDEVVGHAGAEAQVADAVVAARVLPFLVAHPQHLPTPDPSKHH